LLHQVANVSSYRPGRERSWTSSCELCAGRARRLQHSGRAFRPARRVRWTPGPPGANRPWRTAVQHEMGELLCHKRKKHLSTPNVILGARESAALQPQIDHERAATWKVSVWTKSLRWIQSSRSSDLQRTSTVQALVSSDQATHHSSRRTQSMTTTNHHVYVYLVALLSNAVMKQAK